MLYFRDSVPLVKLDVEFYSSYFCFFLTLQPLLFCCDDHKHVLMLTGDLQER